MIRTRKIEPTAPATARFTRGAIRGTLVGVRLQPDLLRRLDVYAGNSSRPEAIRRLIKTALSVYA